MPCLKWLVWERRDRVDDDVDENALDRNWKREREMKCVCVCVYVCVCVRERDSERGYSELNLRFGCGSCLSVCL